jgi:hypothetical protein
LESARFSIVGSVYAVIVALTLLMLILSIPFGAYAILSPHLSTSGYTYNTVISFVPIYIGLFTVNLPLTPTVGVLLFTLTGLYAVFLAVAAAQGGGFVRAIRSSTREGMGAFLRNPLTATIMILGATLLATTVLDLLQTSVGVQTGGLSGDPYNLLFTLTLAPLIEEVGFRFFLIGVPLVVVMFLMRGHLGRMIKSLWRPSAAWDGIGAEDRGAAAVPFLKLLTYFLMVLSSVMFGLAHYLSGSGWDIGKVSEAALDGFALAYLYVRYGLHASIIFHWIVDFASNAFAFYGQAAYGISWTANSSYSLIPALDLIYIVGLPAFVYFANLLLKRAMERRKGPALPEQSQGSLASGSL